MYSESKFAIRTKCKKFEGFDFANEGEWKGEFFFVQGADSQLGMIDSYVNRNPNPTWSAEIELCEKAVAAINRMRPSPRFFTICGDLVDAMPGVSSSKAAQVMDFKKVFAKLDPKIPLVCVCGNHDVGDIPDRDSVLMYRRDFGDDFFSFWVGGCRFIVLNSQYFVDSSQVEDFKREQDVWLDAELKADRNWKHLIGFQHIPPFLLHRDEVECVVPNVEQKLFFNFAQKDVRYAFLDKLKAAGMKKLFCGHYHRNAGGFDEDFEVIVTSAIGCELGNDPHGLRIVKVSADAVQHKYYGFDKIPSKLV